MPSPYYPGRYEGLEMHSPAPPSHGLLRPHHVQNNTGSSNSSWNVSFLKNKGRLKVFISVIFTQRLMVIKIESFTLSSSLSTHFR